MNLIKWLQFSHLCLKDKVWRSLGSSAANNDPVFCYTLFIWEKRLMHGLLLLDEITGKVSNRARMKKCSEMNMDKTLGCVKKRISGQQFIHVSIRNANSGGLILK